MRKTPKARKSGFPTIKLVIVFAAIAAVAAIVFMTSTKSTNASPKKYKATREIVVDQQTGQRRLPTETEIDEVVANLSQLTNRPEDLPSSQGAGDTVTVDLNGGYNGVVLARPGSDGGYETRCVFTFEEGAEFLGLVEDTSAE